MMKKGNMVANALDFSEMPKTNLPEIAFLGRSNAGKSSLINRLVGAKVAHTSATPGKTLRIHFYEMPKWYIVDLPGFGYAKVSKTERETFGQAIEQYLTERQPLIAGVLIQDIRRNPQEEEDMVVQWASSRNVLLIVAASKMDKLNRAEQKERLAHLNAVYPFPVYAMSSRTGEGIAAIQQAIGGLGLSL